MHIAFFLMLVYVVLVYLRPQEYVVAFQDAPVLPIFMIASAIALLFQSNKNFSASQHWLLPVLLLAMVLSVMTNGWFGGSVTVFTEFFPIVILYFLISTSTDTTAKHILFMRTLALLTTILALHGIDQIETGVGWTGAKVIEGRITYIGFFNDPNDLALAFVIALPLLGYCLAETKRFVVKIFWLACIGCVLYGIYLTNSRGGMLGAIAIFLLYFHAKFGMLRSFTLGIIGIIALSALPSRLNELDAGEESAAGRVDAWFEGLQMLMQKPIFGVGKGLFTEHNYLTAHNSIVLAFAELGLVGYFFWLAVVGLSILMVYKISTTKADQLGDLSASDVTAWSQCKDISRAYVYAMLGFFVCAFFLSRSYNILLFMLCALCVALYQVVRNRWPQFVSITFRQFAGKILAFEFGSIAFMFVLVKVLLILGQ